ncbi:hypothetical protein AC579_9082 [Pseudocercospora musae]|uniref:BTB domain-containing protein n=1 Tax=Pseudocercospora musae TaxID=113226 RepID=A0A139IFD9_9PEZI|nr:hypothetical protein AC579_9082 [Pseudocercospora musae]
MTDHELESIAPDGDTVLVIGAAKHKYLVSSKRLSEASSVFAALFSPHFREGQRHRSASEPVEIDLPDDDWRSMRRIFNMLHASPSREQGCTWWSGELLDLAISADKYDLVDAMRFGVSAIFSEWFQDRSTCPSIHVLGQMIAAAYLLEDENAFRLGTTQVVRLSTDSMTDLYGEKCCDILPPFVLVTLEEQRARARSTLMHDVVELERTRKCWSCVNVYPDTYKYPFQEKLCRELGVRFWPPPPNTPLETILSKIGELQSRGHSIGCGHTWANDLVAALLGRANYMTHGLCLSCVYEEKFRDAATCAGH